MKLILLFLIGLLPLSATPSGYLAFRDTFFGQNEEKYAVIRYTFENKGSHYEFFENAEFREYLKKDNTLVQKHELYKQELLTNGITEDGKDKLTKTINDKFNLTSKFLEYDVSAVVERQYSDNEISISPSKEYVLVNDSLNLLDGKKITDVFGMKSDEFGQPSFQMIRVKKQYYLKMINTVFADHFESNNIQIVALSDEICQRLWWDKKKVKVYLALSFYKERDAAVNWVKETKQHNFGVWKISDSERPYAIVLKDGEKIVKNRKVEKWEKLLDTKLTPMLPSSMLYPLRNEREQ